MSAIFLIWFVFVFLFVFEFVFAFAFVFACMTMMATVWNAGIIFSDQVDSICRQIAAGADADADADATQSSH